MRYRSKADKEAEIRASLSEARDAVHAALRGSLTEAGDSLKAIISDFPRIVEWEFAETITGPTSEAGWTEDRPPVDAQFWIAATFNWMESTVTIPNDPTASARPLKVRRDLLDLVLKQTVAESSAKVAPSTAEPWRLVKTQGRGIWATDVDVEAEARRRCGARAYEATICRELSDMWREVTNSHWSAVHIAALRRKRRRESKAQA